MCKQIDPYDIHPLLGTHPTYSWTVLHVAARQGHEEVVKILLDNGADPKLHAVEPCGCEAVSHLINAQASSNSSRMCTPLHLAACSGHESIAMVLVDAIGPSELNENPDNGMASIHLAAQYGRLDLLTFLTENPNQNIEVEDSWGHTALDLAYIYGHWHCFDYLLSKGANINQPQGAENSLRRSMLVDACYYQTFDDALRLIDLGANTNVVYKDEEGKSWPLLHLCLKYPWKDAPHQQYYLQCQRNCKMTWRDYSRDTPKFSKGEFHGYGLRLLKLLILRGAVVNTSEPGEPPLVAATLYGLAPVVKHLLSAGADANVSSTACTPPLLVACKAQAVRSIISSLLEQGANVNEEGKTPLQLACNSLSNLDGEEEAKWAGGIVQRLLMKGIDPKQIAPGQSALHLVCKSCGNSSAARSRTVIDAIRLLLDYGADPKPRARMDGGTMNPLEQALNRSDLEAARLLLTKFDTASFTDKDVRHMFKSVLPSSNADCLRLVLSLDRNDIILGDNRSVLRLLKTSKSAPEAAAILVAGGAALGGETEGEGNEVYWAVKHHRGVDLVQQLLKRGTSPDSVRRNKSYNSCALLAALKSKDAERRRGYVEVLLKHGANINLEVGVMECRNKYNTLVPYGGTGATPLGLALRGPYDEDIVRLMVASPTAVSWSQEQREFYLRELCTDGSTLGQTASAVLKDMLVGRLSIEDAIEKILPESHENG
ncbi:ankyrin repeat-containing domain protein [Xylariales sp. AK1849]|nr:ankyrin repeat-containing domain protein [Xylariales sp. AK1849]